ncbi:MAG TPA: O-antigen polymerase, partial [Ignavibacteriaceae bacterium]|nr:O-antigen polymerase [Ignavibacteriaceae bacterium]
AVLLYYGSFKLKASYIFVIISILIIVIYGISDLRAGDLFIEILYYTGQMKFNKSFAIFTEPYMYITMNLENFAFSVEKLTDYTFGYYSFDFFLALTGLKHWIAEYSNLNPLPYLVNPGYNTYTMFFVYYRDFGIIGSLFFPLILGISSYVIYLKMLFKPNINSVSLYGIVTFVIIFSFFIPMLNWLHFVYNIALIQFLTKIITLE